MMSSVVKDKEVMLLTELGPYDVLLGRGTGPNENQGNRYFRDEVRKGEDEYCRQSQSRVAKDLVVLHTIEAVRERGGRFVRRVRQCKKRKKTNKNVFMKGIPQESCDLYEVESKRDTVIEKVRQAFQYCRRRPTTDKRSTKKNKKVSLKLSPDESLLGSKKPSTSCGGQQNPTTTTSSRRTAAAGAGAAGTSTSAAARTFCSLEDERQRHAAVCMLDQITGACSKKSYSQQQGQDEQVQRAILIASIMGKTTFQEEEQQSGRVLAGGDAPISMLQQRSGGGAPVQDPAASNRSNTRSPGASSLFIRDILGSSRSATSSTYPSRNAAGAVTTTTPVPNLLQFLSMNPAARSMVAPSNYFFAYPSISAQPSACLLGSGVGGTWTQHATAAATAATATTRGSTTFSAVPPPSGIRGVGLQQGQELSNVLENHQHLLMTKIRKLLFENQCPAPPPLASPLIYSLFQDSTSTIISSPNYDYY
jgi:hypothetical protein